MANNQAGYEGSATTRAPRMLTVSEIAELTSYSYHTVLKWIHAKKLPAVQLGGSSEYRIHPRDLAAFLGTDSGTEAISEAAQVVEKLAPFERCQASKGRKSVGKKDEWRQQYRS